MKRILCMILVLSAILCIFTACDFAQNLTDTLEEKSESATKVEELLAALSEKRMDDAKALMHPSVNENASAGLEQMMDYIDGRKVVSMELSGINVSVSSGTAGKVSEEHIGYILTLSDGVIISTDAVYLSNSAGVGFTSFGLVIGVI